MRLALRQHGSPPTDPTRENRSAGFTLFEVLLATAIFAIVLIAINTVFFAALHLRRSVSDALDRSVPLNQALALMRRDLQNAVPPGGVLAGNFRMGGPVGMLGSTSTTGTGTGSTAAGAMGSAAGGSAFQTGGLDFFTTTGVLREDQPWGDIQEVNYQLLPSERADAPGQDLVRSVTRNLLTYVTPTPQVQRLVRNIEDLEFEFFDGTQWLDTWDTTAGSPGLPTAVRVRILPVPSKSTTVRQEPIELLVRLYTVSAHGSTNATAAAEDVGGAP